MLAHFVGNGDPALGRHLLLENAPRERSPASSPARPACRPAPAAAPADWACRRRRCTSGSESRIRRAGRESGSWLAPCCGRRKRRYVTAKSRGRARRRGHASALHVARAAARGRNASTAAHARRSPAARPVVLAEVADVEVERDARRSGQVCTARWDSASTTAPVAPAGRCGVPKSWKTCATTVRPAPAQAASANAAQRRHVCSSAASQRHS